jgi:hypothetical protein
MFYNLNNSWRVNFKFGTEFYTSLRDLAQWRVIGLVYSNAAPAPVPREYIGLIVQLLYLSWLDEWVQEGRAKDRVLSIKESKIETGDSYNVHRSYQN